LFDGALEDAVGRPAGQFGLLECDEVDVGRYGSEHVRRVVTTEFAVSERIEGMHQPTSATAPGFVVRQEPYAGGGPRRVVEEAEAELIARYGALSDDELGLTAAMFDPPKGTFLVARSGDGDVVGGVGVRPFEPVPGVGEIKRLWVDQVWRRRGLGLVLMARSRLWRTASASPLSNWRPATASPKRWLSTKGPGGDAADTTMPVPSSRTGTSNSPNRCTESAAKSLRGAGTDRCTAGRRRDRRHGPS
jgi:GNAT superfamily N-acetyltransferase